MSLFISWDIRPLQQDGHQQPGGQGSQQVVHVLVGPGGQLPHQTGVQGGLVQGGLQVDSTGVLVPVKVPHVGAGRQHQGPGQAEVGEQQLPLLLVDRLFFAVFYRQSDVFQRQTLHLRTEGVGGLQRHQGWFYVNQGVTQLLRHPEAVAGGAGGGIGHSAGGQDHRLAGKASEGFPFSHLYAAHRPILEAFKADPRHPVVYNGYL